VSLYFTGSERFLDREIIHLLDKRLPDSENQ